MKSRLSGLHSAETFSERNEDGFSPITPFHSLWAGTGHFSAAATKQPTGGPGPYRYRCEPRGADLALVAFAPGNAHGW